MPQHPRAFRHSTRHETFAALFSPPFRYYFLLFLYCCLFFPCSCGSATFPYVFLSKSMSRLSAFDSSHYRVAAYFLRSAITTKAHISLLVFRTKNTAPSAHTGNLQRGVFTSFPHTQMSAQHPSIFLREWHLFGKQKRALPGGAVHRGWNMEKRDQHPAAAKARVILFSFFFSS